MQSEHIVQVKPKLTVSDHLKTALSTVIRTVEMDMDCVNPGTLVKTGGSRDAGKRKSKKE